MSSMIFKKIGLPLKLIISMGLLILIVWNLDMPTLSNMLIEINFTALIAATGFMLAQMGFLARRWQLLINADLYPSSAAVMSYKKALRISVASQLANLLFITAISGLVVRIALTAQHGITVMKTVCAAILDRFLTLFALGLLTIAFLPGLGQYLGANIQHHVILFIGLALMLAAGLFISLTSSPIKSFLLARPKLAGSLSYLLHLIKNPLFLAKLVIISLIAQISYFLAVYALSAGNGAPIDLMQLMCVLPIIALVASLPISFGGWGIREGAFIYGLGLLGVPMEMAFIISVEIGLLSMVTTALAGLPTLTTDKDLHYALKQSTETT